MGKFKDEHGIGRVKAFLNKIGRSDIIPKILEAGKDVFQGNYFDAVQHLIGNGSKEDLTPDQIELLKAELSADISEQMEITKRWISDNNNESWLPRNIRPLTLASLLIVFFTLVYLDSFTNVVFEVKDLYLTIFEALLLTTIVAYFGSRGYGKAHKRSLEKGKNSIFTNPFKRKK